MIKEKMEVSYNIGDNGKPRVNFVKTHSSLTQFNRVKSEKFRCGRTTLFLTEQKINNPKLVKERGFVLSLRQEGCHEDTGEYRQTQMHFNEEDLIMVRDNIDKILYDTYVEKQEDKNGLFGCGKKYKVRYFYGGSYKEFMIPGSKIETVTGVLVGYDNPWVGRMFLETEDNGFEIIPMMSIIDMKEIE